MENAVHIADFCVSCFDVLAQKGIEKHPPCVVDDARQIDEQ